MSSNIVKHFYLNVMLYLHVAGMASSGFSPWIPPDVEDLPLLCSDYCLSNYGSSYEQNKCCYCNHVNEWEINQTKTNELHIEYRDIKGSDAILVAEWNYNDTWSSTVTHTFRRLSSLPVNMCLFTEIVSLVLSNNVILDVENTSCLYNVEVIDLRANKIKRISNTTFTSLKKLRKLDLSYNEISHIDSNSFQGKDRSIFNINLSHMKLKEIDVSNTLFQKGFCEIIYDDNPVIKFSNPSKFQIDTGRSYGSGGKLLLRNLRVGQYINYTDIGLHDLSEYYKVFNIRFDTANTQVSCDCLFYPILESTVEIVSGAWLTFWNKLNLTCGNPKGLENIQIIDIINDKSLREKMICERKDSCPRNCTCYEQPINRHLVVNCSKSGLKDIPRTLPWFPNMTLLMDGNNIRSIPDADYLERIHSLDISSCSVTNIATKAVDRLPKGVILNITGNPLRKIPNDLILKSVSLGALKMYCSCDVVGILTWNTYQNIDKTTVVYCQNYGGKSLQEVSAQIRELCDEDKDNFGIIFAIIFAFVGLLIICVSATLCILYGPEALILYRTYIRMNSRYCRTKFENDIYICMDDSNAYLRKWVLRTLVPAFDSLRMRVFLPCRDSAVGQGIEENLSGEIDNSRTFIIILSNSFERGKEDNLKSTVLAMEINRIWFNFKKRPIKNIIAINFDNLKSSNVHNRYVKAILRCHIDINVTDRYQKVVQRVIETLKRYMYIEDSQAERKTVLGISSIEDISDEFIF